MKGHRQFDAMLKKMISSQERWKIVSSLFPPDHNAVDDSAHRQWLSSHADKHLSREILFVISGKMLCSHEGRLFPSIPGTIFLFDAGESHDNFYPPWANAVTHLWLSFVKHRIFARLLYVNEGRIKGKKMSINIMVEDAGFCDLIELELSGIRASPLEPDMKRKKLKALLLLILLKLLEIDLSGEGLKWKKSEHISKVVEVIRKHIEDTAGKGLSVKKLARIAGYSIFHFLRIFKRETGQTIHECINASRIKKTREMLDAGYSKKQISDKLGFSCPPAFSNWYARHSSAISGKKQVY